MHNSKSCVGGSGRGFSPHPPNKSWDKRWDNIFWYNNDINGLNKYAIYDVNVELKNDKETVNKRVIIVYRNDKTFTVEAELIEN